MNPFVNTLAGAVVGAVVTKLADSKDIKAHWDDHPEDRGVMVGCWILLGWLLLSVLVLSLRNKEG